MARVPGIQFAGSPAGPADVGIPAVPGVQGSTGGALKELGKGLDALAGDLMDTYQRVQGTSYAANAQKQLQDYAFELKHGGVDEKGNQFSPADPSKHGELYQQKVEQITEEAGQDLIGRAVDHFESDFRPFAVRQELAVKEGAIELVGQKISVDTKNTLRQSANTFVDADNLQKPEIQRAAFASIDDLVGRGVWTPEEALREKRVWVDDANRGSATKMMAPKGGPEALIAAIDRGEFNESPADVREYFRKAAHDESDRRVKRALLDADHQEARELRAERKTQKDTALEGLGLHTKDELTPEWVQEKIDKGALSFDNGRLLMKMARGQEDAYENRELMAQLTLEASKGRDVTDRITQAAIDGEISVDNMKYLFGVVKSEGVGITGQNYLKEGTAYIEQILTPDKELAQPAARMKAAYAVRRFRDWVQENPTANKIQARQEYETLLQQALMWDPRNEEIGSFSPRYLEGPKEGLTYERIQAAARATKDAFERKEISESVYEEEKKILTVLGRAYPKPVPAAAKR